MKTLSEWRRDLGKDYIRSEKQIKKAKREDPDSPLIFGKGVPARCVVVGSGHAARAGEPSFPEIASSSWSYDFEVASFWQPPPPNQS